MVQPISFNDPYSVRALEIERRRRMAEQLRNQALQPIRNQPPVGGVAIRNNPLQGLAQMLQSYTAGQELRGADQESRQLAQQYEGERQGEMDAIAKALRGQEAIPNPPDEVGGGPGRAAVPGDANLAAQVAFGSRFGDIRSMGPGFLNVAETRANRQADRDWRTEERVAKAQERMEELTMKLEDRRLDREERARLERERDETRRMIAAGQQQIALGNQALRRDVMAQGGRPPAGYRWTPDQNLEPIPGGPGDKADKPPTEFQGKAALYGTRAAQSDKILTELEDKISTTGLSVKQAAANTPIVGGALGAVGNVMLSKNQQKVDQAQRDFVNAVLRQESGAVISPAEFANAQKQYFPAPGDDESTVQQKRQNRKLAIEGFRRMAGPVAGDIQAIMDAPLLPGKSEPKPERRSADRRAPPNVDPALWAAMTPEERALWNR